MKKLIIIIISLFPATLSGQWQWAKKIGGTYANAASVYCVDNNNNYYVAGKFRGYLYLPNDTLAGAGLDDGLIIKYDSNGNVIWAKNIGGNNTSVAGEILSVTIDNTGNHLIAVGTFYGTLTIDANTVISLGNSDIFIAKFDLSGNCVWLKKAGGGGMDVASAFTCDSNNDIFLTGKATDTAYFDTILIPPGNFFGKYDQNGVCLSAQIKYSNLDIYAIKKINGNLFMAGTTAGVTITMDTITRTFLAPLNAFIAKVDAIGNIFWFNAFGSYSNTYCMALDVNNQSEIYLSGYFEDSTTFGNTTIYHSPPTYSDFFVAKLNSSGSPVWVRQSSTSYVAKGTGVSCDIDGNVYATGFFGGSAQFGQFNITANGNADFFLARYNTAGDCLGIRHFGTATSGLCLTDNNNNVVVGGQFINTITIGSQTLNATTINTPDLFIAKADEITGIGGENRTANNQLIIYANPNQGKCNITVPDDFLNEKNLTLSIYDNTGKLIQQKTLEMNDGKIKVSLEEEAKGVYNVTLASRKKSYNGKIVFE